MISAPEAQRATLSGFAADIDGAAIPGATVTVDGPTTADHETGRTDETGFFKLIGLHAGVVYRVSITANDFSTQTFEAVTLLPGQDFELRDIKLRPEVDTTVTAESGAQIAIEEEKTEEQQRIFGVIPNFYVVYDHNVEPLSTRLKYKLAFRATTDIFNFASAAFLSAIDQAADTPNYVQGARGYGQRVGANYADGASDILLGGAILPALLHQDPRYFYQGTGTKKSRARHALASPFFCRGDNGKLQFNYSSIGGDLGSGALSNIYYPPSNRGVGLVFSSAAITTGGRMINALAQEFVLSKLTKRGSAK